MDFSAFDTAKTSNSGVEFKFIDMRDATEMDAGAVMYGPESEQFRNATYRINSEILSARLDKKRNEFEVEARLELERIIECTKTLIDVEYPTGTHITTNKKQIRVFYEACPWAYQQMDTKIKSRLNFLPVAEKAGKSTSSKKRG